MEELQDDLPLVSEVKIEIDTAEDTYGMTQRDTHELGQAGHSSHSEWPESTTPGSEHVGVKEEKKNPVPVFMVKLEENYEDLDSTFGSGVDTLQAADSARACVRVDFSVNLEVKHENESNTCQEIFGWTCVNSSDIKEEMESDTEWLKAGNIAGRTDSSPLWVSGTSADGITNIKTEADSILREIEPTTIEQHTELPSNGKKSHRKANNLSAVASSSRRSQKKSEAQRKRETRLKETEEKRKARLLADRERKKRAREAASPETINRQREAARQRMRDLRQRASHETTKHRETARQRMRQADKQHLEDLGQHASHETTSKHRQTGKQRMRDLKQNASPETIHRRREAAKQRMRERRQNASPETISRHRQAAKLRMRELRQNQSLRMTSKRTQPARQHTNGQRKTAAPVTFEEARLADRQRKKRIRETASFEMLEEMRKKDRHRKRQKRITQLGTTPQQAINIFQMETQHGPTYICICCQRLLYKTAVVIYKPLDFVNTEPKLFHQCIPHETSGETNGYICTGCKRILQANKIPVFAPCNGLEVEDVPHLLKDLNPLEVVFLSRRIPFIKIVGLCQGRQKSVHETVVNLPVNPEETISALPRVASPDTIVGVELKKKLHNRACVSPFFVNPHKVIGALQLLKDKNPLYADVAIRDDWQQQSEEQNPALWHTLTQSTGCVDKAAHDLTQSEDEEEEENMRSRYRGQPMDTCLQPKDFMSDNNILQSFATGEGKKPQPFYTDPKSEELSFPHLFPSGQFGFSAQRPVPLSVKQYFQARLLHRDTRFASCTDYLFYAQYRCETKAVCDYRSLALRKGKQTDSLTAGSLMRKGRQTDDLSAGSMKRTVDNLVRSDFGMHFLQKVRGSPAYFNKMLLDLLGMIRQLGPCTWFVTLSAADLRWPDLFKVIQQQQGSDLTDEQFDQLTWEERCNILRSNPVTAARHFDHRVKLFMKHIVLNKNISPVGNVQDYKFRIEFEQRGSPRLHMLVWTQGAPSFETHTAEEVAAFVDQHSSCKIPHEDDDLKGLLDLQTHQHTKSCKKGGKICRFLFPRPLMKQTMAFKPPSEELSESQKKEMKAALEAVQEVIAKTELDVLFTLTVDDILQKANVKEEEYMSAVGWAKTSKGQPAVLLKRSPAELFINNYNATLMKAWRASLDIQFVTNVYACIMYVASYISKPEKSKKGDLLKNISKSGQHLSQKQSLRSIAHHCLTHREISTQEAVYRLLSLPLTRTSRQILFVPTDLPEERTRLLKPMAVLEQLEDDDSDLFLKGILERYQARPETLEKQCLADFAANYSYTAKSQGDANEVEGGERPSQLPRKIILQDNMGSMILRRKPAVVRSHKFSPEKHPEQYCHSQLLLYYPWRCEQALSDPSYSHNYQEKLQVIKDNQSRFECHASVVDAAVEALEAFGPNQDGWDQPTFGAQEEEIEDSKEHSEELHFLDLPAAAK